MIEADDILTLAETLLTHCIEQPGVSRRAQKSNAVGGPIWGIDVPVSRDLVRRVVEYAETKEVTVQGALGAVTGKLKSLTATATHLVADVEADGRSEADDSFEARASVRLKYRSEMQRALATGEEWAFAWGSRTVAKLTLTRLMPELIPTTYGAELRLGVKIMRPAMFGGWKEESLRYIELHYGYARPVVGRHGLLGWIKTTILPDIRFTAPVAALFALLLSTAAADAGEVRRAKRVGRALAKPIRSQGRADAGYPFWSTAENVSGIALKLVSPFRWFF